MLHPKLGFCTAGRGGPSHGLEAELLPRMLDLTIRSYFPDIWRAHLGDTLRARPTLVFRRRTCLCEHAHESLSVSSAPATGLQPTGSRQMHRFLINEYPACMRPQVLRSMWPGISGSQHVDLAFWQQVTRASML